MKWQFVEETLENQGLALFTSQEMRRATGLSPASIKQLLIRYVKKGLVLQLKENRGLYCLKNKKPHPWLLANKLLRPSYISLETALAHYGAIPESVYGITSVTPLSTRKFQSMGLDFTYQKIKKSSFGRYLTIEKEGATVFIAELEKALADYLYFVHLGRKEWNERIRWSMFNRRTLFEHLKSYQRRGLVEWVKNVIPKNNP